MRSVRNGGQVKFKNSIYHSPHLNEKVSRCHLVVAAFFDDHKGWLVIYPHQLKAIPAHSDDVYVIQNIPLIFNIGIAF